ARRRGFADDEAPLEVHSDPKAHGSYNTAKLGDKGRFDRVAFVSVRFDGKVRATMPIVVLDDQPVTVPVTLQEDDTTLAESGEKRSWKKDVFDSYLVQSTVFTELQQLSAKKDTPRAKLIETARDGAKRSAEDLLRLR